MFVSRSPRFRDELMVTFVVSPRADVRINAIDVKAVLDIAGIVGVFTAIDVPGENWLVTDALDAELLVANECRYAGQPVIALAGESLDALRAAIAAIRLEVSPAAVVLTSDEATAVPDLTSATQRIVRGEPLAALAVAEHLLAGTFHAHGADDFDPATPSTVAFLRDNGQLFVHLATPSPDRARSAVAHCLGLREDRVICFGPETRTTSAGLELRRPRRRVGGSCRFQNHETGPRHRSA